MHITKSANYNLAARRCQTSFETACFAAMRKSSPKSAGRRILRRVFGRKPSLTEFSEKTVKPRRIRRLRGMRRAATDR